MDSEDEPELMHDSEAEEEPVREYVLLPAIAHRRKRKRLQEEGEEDTEEDYTRLLEEEMADCKICQVIGIMLETNQELEKLLRVGSAAWEADRKEYLCVPEFSRFRYIARQWNDNLLPELQARALVEATVSNFRQPEPPTMDVAILVQWTSKDVSRHFNNCTRLREVKIVDGMLEDFQDIYETMLKGEIVYRECRDHKLKHDPKQMILLLKLSTHIKQLCLTRYQIASKKVTN